MTLSVSEQFHIVLPLISLLVKDYLGNSMYSLICFAGLIPWFLRHRIPMLKMGPDINTLYFFTQSGDDGSRLRWAHGINNGPALETALACEQHLFCTVMGPTGILVISNELNFKDYNVLVPWF